MNKNEVGIAEFRRDDPLQICYACVGAVLRSPRSSMFLLQMKL